MPNENQTEENREKNYNKEYTRYRRLTSRYDVRKHSVSKIYLIKYYYALKL